jgi:TPR repeat protein
MFDQLIGFVSPTAALNRAMRLLDEKKFTAALPLLTRAARAGIPDAEYRVARCYLEGAGVPASRAEATRWLERASEHGFAEAQAMLAALYVRGLARGTNGVAKGEDAAAGGLFVEEDLNEAAAPDFASALHWARFAAEAGSPEGQALLGYVLTYGPEEMRDLDQAHQWYARSAASGCQQGHLGYALSLARLATDDKGRRAAVDQLRCAAISGLATALYLLGEATETGVGADRDPALAAEYYRQAAEKGHRRAQVKWGVSLIEGRYVAQDAVGGESWLRRAALAGDSQAAALVGNLYARSGPLPPNYAEAASWYRRAAEGGDRTAARALGSLYLTGAGVAQDDQEAARWLRLCAEAGDQGAQAELGNLLLRGAGDPDDSARLASWFEQAAESGDLTGAFNLGVCLIKGLGREQDEEKAAQWLRRAADGVAEAQYMYGRMLAEGRGVRPDLPEARAWFARAADAGVVDAQVALAEMMANGRGGPAYPTTALDWFEKAAGKGHSGAMFALGALHAGASAHAFPTDGVAAERWFRAAAERGHGQAQLMLGRYLANGAAGHQDLSEARLWLERALAQGISEAASDLAKLKAPLGVE